MAGLDPGAIRTAIKTQLGAASISRAITVYDYPPEACSYPCIAILHAGESADYAVTFGATGIASMAFRVEIRTTSADGISAAKALDDLISAGTGADSSVYDALNADHTLSGAIRTFTFTGFSPPQIREDVTGTRFMAASFTITCHASRS